MTTRPMHAGGTLGENLRAARLGFAWLAPFGWLRLSAADDDRQAWRLELAPDGPSLPQPPRGRPAGPHSHVVRWEDPQPDDEPLEQTLRALVRRILCGDLPRPRLRGFVSFVVDDDGQVIAA